MLWNGPRPGWDAGLVVAYLVSLLLTALAIWKDRQRAALARLALKYIFVQTAAFLAYATVLGAVVSFALSVGEGICKCESGSVIEHRAQRMDAEIQAIEATIGDEAVPARPPEVARQRQGHLTRLQTRLARLRANREALETLEPYPD